MKRILVLALALLLVLGGCAPAEGTEDGVLHLLCTTYPVYLFTTAVVGETEGVEVELMVNQPTACLHDYTLTVKDMKALDRADVVVLNGAGLEDFMADALGQGDAAVVDCSEGIDLLPVPEPEGHDHGHGEEYDPHFWMDPRRAAQMVENIAAALSALDAPHRESYAANAAQAGGELEELAASGPEDGGRLITFHDGFQYFAAAFGAELLRAIEEEEGSTASAAEIREIVELVETYRIPAIFVEKNGAQATAGVVARETGCAVYELDMVMSGDGRGIQPYVEAIRADLDAIVEAMR